MLGIILIRSFGLFLGWCARDAIAPRMLWPSLGWIAGVFALCLCRIRDDGSSPVNLMLIRRTAQVIEWLIERVDWFFGEDGLDAMKGPEPDPCTIPTRPAIPAPEPESDDSCTQSQENLSIATIPGHVSDPAMLTNSADGQC